MDARAFLARALEHRRIAGIRLGLDTYGRAAGGLLANGLAFASLFAAIPSILLLLGVAGWIGAGDPTIRLQVRDALVAALPPLADVIDESIRTIGDGAAVTSALGVVGVIWTASQLFSAVDTAFARIFSDTPERDALRRTLRGFLVVGLIAAVIIAVVGTIALLAVFDTLTNTQGSLARGAIVLLTTPLFLGLVICVAVIVGYRKLPPRPPSWHAVVIPAVFVGALLTILSQVFALLVPTLVGVAQLAGSLASVFVTLAWLSFSFQVLLFGAAWVRVRELGPAKPAPLGSASLERPAAAAEPGSGRE